MKLLNIIIKQIRNVNLQLKIQERITACTSSIAVQQNITPNSEKLIMLLSKLIMLLCQKYHVFINNKISLLLRHMYFKRSQIYELFCTSRKNSPMLHIS